jgi:pimeloyl-ACP methyl ester carboxylesterase
MCGRTRPAVRVDVGSVARARPPGRRRAVRVDRCESARWVPVGIRRARGRARRVALDTSEDGDFRVRARGARAAYLRVGVGEIVDAGLRFTVRNLNRSAVTCPADGAEYKIAGHLVAPRSALSGAARPGVTLYLHGVEVTGGYFHIPVAGYDLVYELARLGHASVVIDRLGYGASDRPPGLQTCSGAHADMAHQVVEALLSGSYDLADRGEPPRFDHVALAGHSGGALATQIAAYSFRGFDAVAVMAFHDQGESTHFRTVEFTGEAPLCAAGGVRADGDSGPPGYAYLWTTTDGWLNDSVFDVTPEVREGLRPLRRRTPCGELASGGTVGAFDAAHLGSVRVPVLLLYGEEDALYPYADAPAQRDRYSGSESVTFVGFPKAGHVFFLEKAAAVQARQVLSGWLRARGF